MTRQERDHLRYLRHHDERLKKQREYYAAHREQCREAVRLSRLKLKRNYERRITTATDG